MLNISNLTKRFDEKVVLDGLNLEIKDGSIFGLVGVNGAGKSTLLRTIAGIYQADGGAVDFEGVDTYLDEEIRRQLFFVSDDVYFPFASNIKTLKEFYKSYYNFDEGNYQKYLNLFKLDENKPINTFSKGMKRQTLLIFALAVKPKLLMLDEAFDGLDPIVRYNLKMALGEFIDENESMIIISSHNLKELEDICDSFGILEDGKIRTYGDLLESKANINKYQLAFARDIDEMIFDQFEVLYKNKEGSIYTLVIKGDKETTIDKLSKYKPVVLDSLPVNFEELFIYEQKGKENV